MIGMMQHTLQEYRSRIALLVVLCAVIYFVIAFGEQSWRARQLQAQAGEQRIAIAAMKRENAELRQQLDVYSTDAYVDYVQSRARRDLNLANPDETVIAIRWGERLAAPASPTATPATDEQVPNWRAWLDALVLE